MSDVRIPAGFHFQPTEKELIEAYLKRKQMGQPLPSSCVIERDLYSAAPWDIFTDRDPWETIETENSLTGRTKTEHVIYVLTRLKMVSKKRVSRIAGCGTWDAKTGVTELKNIKKEVIGLKKMLGFEVKKGEKIDDRVKKGHWIMYEYSLAGNQEEEGNYVLCQIKRDDSKSLKRARDSVNDESNDEEQNSDQKRVKNDANIHLMNPYIDSRMEHLPILQNIESQNTTGFFDATIEIWEPQNQRENRPVLLENTESDYGAYFDDASCNNLMMNPCSENRIENLPVVQNTQAQNSSGFLDATTAVWQPQNQRENLPVFVENIELDATTAIWQPQNQRENLSVFVENVEADYGACFEDASLNNLMMTMMDQSIPVEQRLCVSPTIDAELETSWAWLNDLLHS